MTIIQTTLKDEIIIALYSKMNNKVFIITCTRSPLSHEIMEWKIFIFHMAIRIHSKQGGILFVYFNIYIFHPLEINTLININGPFHSNIIHVLSNLKILRWKPYCYSMRWGWNALNFKPPKPHGPSRCPLGLGPSQARCLFQLRGLILWLCILNIVWFLWRWFWQIWGFINKFSQHSLERVRPYWQWVPFYAAERRR